MPQVTVIIPTCNRAQSLGAALESVLAQQFDDFEVIVVDDAGAPDATAAVESCRDSRVSLLRHAVRRGGGAARNTGIARARGEYVAFLDDDDQWLPDKLVRQVALMRNSTSVGGCYTGCWVIERQSGRVLQQIVPGRKGKLYPEILADNYIGGTSSVMVRRSCLQAVGGFDERLPSFQDYDLWIRLAHEFEFESINEPLVRYSVHGRQVWSNLDVLTRGLEMMLAKYGSDRRFRKQSSVYFLSFGVRYCRNRQAALARKAFLRAVQLAPLRCKTYAYLGASLLGRAGVETLLATKAAFGRSLGAGATE